MKEAKKGVTKKDAKTGFFVKLDTTFEKAMAKALSTPLPKKEKKKNK